MKVRFVTTNRIAFDTGADIFRDVLDGVVADNLEVGVGSLAQDACLRVGERRCSSASDEPKKSRALEMHGGSFPGDER